MVAHHTNKNALMGRRWSDDEIPYICWDRNWTAGEIRRRLQVSGVNERHRVMAWLMRELKTTELWQFITPREIDDNFAELKPFLGPASDLWEYLLGTWHELGKL